MKNLDQFEESAIRTLLSNNGASLHDIASAAGIGRATLHRHFTSREELLHSLALSALADAEQAITACNLEEGTALEAIERLVNTFVPLGHRFHFLLSETSFNTDKEILQREEALLALLTQLMERGQQEGILTHSLPAHWMVEAFSGLLYIAWESIDGGYTAPRDAPKFVLTTLIHGISKA